MMKKKERLTREVFNRFFSSGRRTHAPHLYCVYSQHPKLHCAVVIPKKIVKLAAERNRARRRIYNTIRTTGIKNGVYIFILKKPINTLTPPELRAHITNLVSQS